MSKKFVAIVGKPNVGKSTFFNRLAGERLSIVDDTPGVTRDRLYADVEWLNHKFSIIDTGGLEVNDENEFASHIKAQVDIAVDMADVVVFLVDGRAPVTPAEHEISSYLIKSKKEVILVANKIDNNNIPDNFYDYYSLGLGEPIKISSANMLGIGDLLDFIVEKLDIYNDEYEDDNSIKITFMGKPNVGKSSLVNKLIGEERVIVSDIAGTTRDSINTEFEYNGDNYVLIDTAGIRRRKSISDNIEKYSVIRSVAAIEKSDIAVLLIDATEGITEQEKKIAGIAHDSGRGLIIAVNKWDLVEKETKTAKNFEKKIREELKYCTYAPIIFISALTGKRVYNLLDLIKDVHKHQLEKISTGVLNDIINQAMVMNPPATDKGRALKLYYATQISVLPPTFRLFVNDPELLHFSYVRYLENQIRNNFNFIGTRLVFNVSGRGKD